MRVWLSCSELCQRETVSQQTVFFKNNVTNYFVVILCVHIYIKKSLYRVPGSIERYFINLILTQGVISGAFKDDNNQFASKLVYDTRILTITRQSVHTCTQLLIVIQLVEHPSKTGETAVVQSGGLCTFANWFSPHSN